MTHTDHAQHRRRIIVGASALALFASAAFGMSFLGGPQYDMDWFTIDSGGGTSSGGSFEMLATIGQWDAGAPMSGGSFELAGGFLAGGPPATGEPATLLSVEQIFGTITAGTVAEIVASDDTYLEMNSQFGFSALEANLLQLKIIANSNVSSPATLDVSVEERINNPGGMSKWFLRDYTTGQLTEVHVHATTQSDVIETVEDFDPALYIKNDGEIEVQVKQSVVATFSAQGFDSFFDFVELFVE